MGGAFVMERFSIWLRRSVFAVLFVALIFTIYRHYFAIDKTQEAVIGEVTPNFRLQTINDGELELKDLRGQALLINFWGSWCTPCKNEMPAIQNAYEQYKNDGFEVVAVNIYESATTVSTFLQKNNLSIPVVLDKNGEVYNTFNVRYVPTSFFITPDGTLQSSYEGELSKEQLDQWIKEILPN